MNTLCDFAQRFAPLVGRILVALIFLLSAFGKISDFEGTAGLMASRGMPAAHVLLVCAIAIELVAGALLVIGWHARWAAFALLVFLVPATLYFHNYWSYPPEQVRNQRNHFMKNVSIAGALVLVMGMGAGPLSIDARRGKRAL